MIYLPAKYAKEREKGNQVFFRVFAYFAGKFFL